VLVTVWNVMGDVAWRTMLDTVVPAEYHDASGLRLAPKRAVSGLGRSLPAFLWRGRTGSTRGSGSSRGARQVLVDDLDRLMEWWF